MPYVSHAELAERPGARELAQVASPDHKDIVDYGLMDVTLRGEDRSAWTAEEQEAADAAIVRVDDAVREADGVIDGFLARRYTLPLTAPVPPVVTGWSRAIARYLLHKDRQSLDKDDPIVRDYREALRLLQLAADGKFTLGIGDETVESNGGDVQIVSDAAVFGRDQLKAFR
ncbi:gp436 family protein [Caldimonas sp. KR1-144]|uniref:gp436 family protein n=1 Tax=Caldimonas sp. KR1-144 TaxID=3400911 RepID=UPI003C02E2F1